MTTIFPLPQVNLLTCDRANSVNTRTTAAGTRTLAHTAFGYRSADDEQPAAGFNGEHLERHGTYLLGSGYRAYRPALGRFDAPDSYSPFWGGGLNSYTYCRGEPVNRRDPSGHADDNAWSYAMIGLGAFAFAGGIGLAAFRPKLRGLGLGLAVGGGIGAGAAAMGLGPINKDMTKGLNIAAIALLIAGGFGSAALGRRSSRSANRVTSMPREIWRNPQALVDTVNPIYRASTSSRGSLGAASGLSSITPSRLSSVSSSSSGLIDDLLAVPGFVGPAPKVPAPVTLASSPAPIPHQSAAPPIPLTGLGPSLGLSPRSGPFNRGNTLPDQSGLSTFQRTMKEIRDKAVQIQNRR